VNRTRAVLLILAVLITAFAALTAISIIRDGLSLEGVVGIAVVVFLAVGVIGAAATPPQ
jgi:hypothetical protein